MLTVLRNSWALLLGVMLLMLGNGLQGTLLGVRGKIEGFSAVEMSYVMAGYYVGFLFGSRMAPEMIRRVGHVRVFAALGSLISAVLIFYPVAPDWMFWALLRAVIGFSFSGVYITAESWLNASSTNETRGQALSAYMIMQMLGIIAAQALLNFRDPGGYDLFVIASIAVSVAFTPILLSAGQAPPFERTVAFVYEAPFPGLAARLCRHVPDGRRLCRAVRHGLGLGVGGRAFGQEPVDLRRLDLCGRACLAISDRLGL